MLEDGPIAVPADAGTRIVSDYQGLDELIRSDPGKQCGFLSKWQQPIGDRGGRPEASPVEVVPPAVGGGQALAEPSMKAERRQLHPFDACDQHPFFDWCYDRPGL